ncbi:hypothetical protein Q1695_006853 [Nippostrongylus brasiliensis]|nr:hypothetical protein Q1695_006853 [Nippostrongylus brasiliensis]
MQVFYVSLPWIVDEKDYNCSGRSIAEWKSRGTINLLQGIYFSLSGAVFVILYILCLIGMVRGRLLHIPCYKLMFFNGFVDIVELITGSFVTTYFNLTGTVLCSSFDLEWFFGHASFSMWCGTTFNCAVLAVNRVVEIIPAAKSLKFLFRGNFIYIWIVLSLAYMVARPFFTRPMPFNSTVSAYVLTPMISDDIAWEMTYYNSYYLAFHNVTVLTLLFILYPLLCWYVANIGRAARHSIDKQQIRIKAAPRFNDKDAPTEH